MQFSPWSWPGPSEDHYEQIVSIKVLIDPIFFFKANCFDSWFSWISLSEEHLGIFVILWIYSLC